MTHRDAGRILSVSQNRSHVRGFSMRAMRLVLGSAVLVLALSGCSSPSERIDDSSVADSAESSRPVLSPGEQWLVGDRLTYGPQSIFGDVMVAFEKVPGVDGPPSTKHITLYDLRSREATRVFEVPTDRLAYGAPAIHGNRVVWASVDRDEYESLRSLTKVPLPNWDIFLLELDTGEVRQITTEEHAQTRPRVFGDTVVWLDARHDDDYFNPRRFDVYAYNLSTGQETRLTSTTSAEDSDLSTSGNLVVWTDQRHADPAITIHAGNEPDYNNEIYAFDLSNGEEIRVTTNPGNDHYPVVDGNRIAWLRQWGYREADIFTYRTGDGSEQQVSSSRYAVRAPTIYSDLVAWADARISRGNVSNDMIMVGEPAAGAAIYLRDMMAGEEILVRSATPVESMRAIWVDPVMNGDFVVYRLDRQIGAGTYAMSLVYESEEETRVSLPLVDMLPPAEGQEAPDDIVITPGGRAYRANVHHQGEENPWPSIESTRVVLGSGADSLRISYRDYIETGAGETRNNIIHVGKEGGLHGSNLALYAVAVPAGIELTDGGRGIGLPGATGAVLVIEILPEVAPGRYSLEIGLEIDGKDYGTVPCTIRVIE